MVPTVPMTIVYQIEAYVISESLVMQVRQDGAHVPILEPKIAKIDESQICISKNYVISGL